MVGVYAEFWFLGFDYWLMISVVCDLVGGWLVM